MANVTEKQSQRGFAQLLDVSPQTVSNWCEAGMPHSGGGRHGEAREINVREALPWVAANRTNKPASEKGRLDRERADKLAIENAAKRGDLIRREHIELYVQYSESSVASELHAIGGRLANDLAGISDPAVIRARLLDETKRVRRNHAANLAKLAASEEPSGDLLGDSSAATEQDGESVGGGKKKTARRKRGTRRVAKQ